MAIIERPDYIEQVVRHLDKGLIIVLVGPDFVNDSPKLV